jgi:hypothetical protein
MTTNLRIVEVVGPWLKNRGDELMLWSVAEQCRSSLLAVSTTLGLDELPPNPPLYQVKWTPTLADCVASARARDVGRLLRQLRNTAALTVLSRSKLLSRRVVSGRDLALLLDCSGYAYGDAWSTRRMDEREKYYRRVKRHGAALALLPQALGPFENPSVRHAAVRLLSLFDVVYARDSQSLAHAESLGLRGVTIGLAPDISHLLSGLAPEEPEMWASRVCIVPNERMRDRTAPEEAIAYSAFLTRMVQLVQEAGLEPCLVVHEDNDVALAYEVANQSAGNVPVVQENALVLKGIFGACYAVVSSRYHAVVSALSQATPVLTTSWQHKYEALLNDYGCMNSLIDVSKKASLEQRIRSFLDPQQITAERARLKPIAEAQKQKVRTMWHGIHRRFLVPQPQLGDSVARSRDARAAIDN